MQCVAGPAAYQAVAVAGVVVASWVGVAGAGVAGQWQGLASGRALQHWVRVHRGERARGAGCVAATAKDGESAAADAGAGRRCARRFLGVDFPQWGGRHQSSDFIHHFQSFTHE